MKDIERLVGTIDVSEDPTGIRFDLLNPNNPVYMLEIPGMEDDPFFLSGKDTLTLQDVFKKLNLNIELELKTGDDDEPFETVTLKFDKLSDFEFEKIVQTVQSLQNTQTIINALEKLTDADRVANNPKLVKLLETPVLREALIQYLDHYLDQL